MIGMKLCLKVAPVFLSLLLIAGCDTQPKSNNSLNSLASSGQEQKPSQTETKTDTGRYNGQIDSNSIEVKLSGVPEEMDPQVYRLSETLKEKFDTYKLNTGETIKFKYIINGHGQKVLVDLETLNRTTQK